MDKIKLQELFISNVTHSGLLAIIGDCISNDKKASIAYVNAHSFNSAYNNKQLISLLNSFDVIHPDGIGIYLASIFTGQKLEQRFSGSDFYPGLIKSSLEKKWTYYFFGHDENTLNKISSKYPGLQVKGFNEGYNFDTPAVIEDINKLCPDICIIGLGTPKQEKWIAENKQKINAKVIIAVGDGIKVFAGTKVRGLKIFRKFGIEWLVRLVHNPLKYYKRYLVGNPLFLYRIIKIKFSKLGN